MVLRISLISSYGIKTPYIEISTICITKECVENLWKVAKLYAFSSNCFAASVKTLSASTTLGLSSTESLEINSSIQR